MKTKSGALLLSTCLLGLVLSVNSGFAEDHPNATASSPELQESSQKKEVVTPPSGDSISSTAAAPATTASAPTAAPQSVADAKADDSSTWFSKVGLRWDGVLYGPGVTNINTYQPDLYNKNSYGLPTQTPVFIRNAIGTTYALPGNWIAGATLRADIMPTYIGRDYAIDDSYVRIMNPKLVSHGNFNVSGDLRLYMPTSQASRTTGQSASVTTQFIPSYNFPGTRWSIGAILRQQSYSHYSWANSNAMDTDAYAGPNVNYQITPKLAAGILYEFEAVHYYGTGAFNFTTQNASNPGIMTPTDVEPNISWDITPNINFNPFLNMYPGGKFSLDTTSFGFFFGAKLI
jgi:hypothetical protein